MFKTSAVCNVWSIWILFSLFFWLLVSFLKDCVSSQSDTERKRDQGQRSCVKFNVMDATQKHRAKIALNTTITRTIHIQTETHTRAWTSNIEHYIFIDMRTANWSRPWCQLISTLCVYTFTIDKHSNIWIQFLRHDFGAEVTRQLLAMTDMYFILSERYRLSNKIRGGTNKENNILRNNENSCVQRDIESTAAMQ